MTTSPSLVRFPAPRQTAEHCAKRAADYESIARLVEDSIPNFKKEDERQFYREVIESYRTAARQILRKAWRDGK